MSLPLSTLPNIMGNEFGAVFSFHPVMCLETIMKI